MTEKKLKSGSHLEKILSSGEFAVTGEIGPPKSHDATVIREKCALLNGYVDAANITDNQTGIVRMSSIAAGILIQNEGLEPVIQMTCRDRNRLAMQSDILGAAAHGIKNVLCLSGDHQSFGNHPGAKNVHDLDSMQLIRMTQEMRDLHQFQCGEEIKGGGPPVFIGAAANPFADPVELRPLRLKKKAIAGADFIQTQLIYDMDRFREYMKRVVDLGITESVSILAGVGPLKGAGMARYMHNNVPGMSVPDHIIKRMESAIAGISSDDKEARIQASRAEGIQICTEQIEEIRQIEGVAGVHIMAIEWEAAVKPIVEGAGLYPRPPIET
ncbi:MAG: methylenetetrahydrofolate reductase [Gammaproteobacteria bacterium]|nr:methylenetetrahydrofolate reductase [Gammaproteobacteria bacterium]